MQAIKAYTQIFDDINGHQDILKKIEVCGRVCYKSEGKITEGSAEKFIGNIIKRGHEAVLEHGSFIFETSYGLYHYIKSLVDILETDYEFVSFLRFTNDVTPKVSGNVRAWRSFVTIIHAKYNVIPGFLEDFIKGNPVLFLEYQRAEFGTMDLNDAFRQITVTDLVTKHEKLTHWDVTVKFVTDRGVSHYCQESTRYCNYSKDDFGNEITVIIPPFLDYKSADWNVWIQAMKNAEKDYFELLNIGLTAQEARGVLPNSLKTELVMTANLAEWKTFFELRTSNAAHPQMVEVARPLFDDMCKLIPGVLI